MRSGASGELTVSLATFRMKARDEDVSESYMGQPVAIDESRFVSHLDARRAELKKEVQGRNSRYYDQQEELLYRNKQDRKAEHEGAIRDSADSEIDHGLFARTRSKLLES
jgi:hypothetical protein